MKTYQLETKGDILQIRIRHTLLNPDGSVRTSKLQRQWISPGQDYSGWPRKVRRHAQVFDTPEAIKRYKALQAFDPDAPPAPLVDGETDIIEVIVREDDHVAICKCTEIIENGERFEQIFDPVIVPPGVPVSNAPAKVNAMIAAAHIPTVVNKYESEQAYEAAERARIDTSVAEAIAEQIKIDTYQIRVLAKATHDKAMLADSEDAEALALMQEALALRKIEAIAKHTAAVAAHRDAVTAATEAKDAVPPALAARTAARQAHDDFEAGD